MVRSTGWVSANFSKNARPVGRLGSGPRLDADRADVVFTHALVLQVGSNAILSGFIAVCWSRIRLEQK